MRRIQATAFVLIWAAVFASALLSGCRKKSPAPICHDRLEPVLREELFGEFQLFAFNDITVVVGFAGRDQNNSDDIRNQLAYRIYETSTFGLIAADTIRLDTRANELAVSRAPDGQVLIVAEGDGSSEMYLFGYGDLLQIFIDEPAEDEASTLDSVYRSARSRDTIMTDSGILHVTADFDPSQTDSAPVLHLVSRVIDPETGVMLNENIIVDGVEDGRIPREFRMVISDRRILVVGLAGGIAYAMELDEDGGVISEWEAIGPVGSSNFLATADKEWIHLGAMDAAGTAFDWVRVDAATFEIVQTTRLVDRTREISYHENALAPLERGVSLAYISPASDGNRFRHVVADFEGLVTERDIQSLNRSSEVSAAPTTSAGVFVYTYGQPPFLRRGSCFGGMLGSAR